MKNRERNLSGSRNRKLFSEKADKNPRWKVARVNRHIFKKYFEIFKDTLYGIICFYHVYLIVHGYQLFWTFCHAQASMFFTFDFIILEIVNENNNFRSLNALFYSSNILGLVHLYKLINFLILVKQNFKVEFLLFYFPMERIYEND